MKIRSYHLSMRNIMCYVQRNQYNTPAVLEVKKITSLTSLGNNPPKFDSRTEALRNIVYFDCIENQYSNWYQQRFEKTLRNREKGN